MIATLALLAVYCSHSASFLPQDLFGEFRGTSRHHHLWSASKTKDHSLSSQFEALHSSQKSTPKQNEIHCFVYPFRFIRREYTLGISPLASQAEQQRFKEKQHLRNKSRIVASHGDCRPNRKQVWWRGRFILRPCGAM